MKISKLANRKTAFTAKSERDVFRRQGFGQPFGLGTSPALLVVDFIVGFNRSAVFGGGNVDRAIRNTALVLKAARAAQIPIAHTRVAYAEDGSDADVWCRKLPKLGLLTERSPLTKFVPAVSPRRGELVIRKRLPSAFFGTDLAGILLGKGVDTLFVAGCMTSGCVRASVVDAMCHGFRTVVIEDCVGDRARGPHRASLFDMEQKYADLMNGEQAIEKFGRFGD